MAEFQALIGTVETSTFILLRPPPRVFQALIGTVETSPSAVIGRKRVGGFKPS